MMEEPSVLDYVIDRLTFWREKTLHLQEEPGGDEQYAKPQQAHSRPQTWYARLLGWRGLLALPLILAWMGQIMLEPPDRAPTTAVFCYILAGGTLVALTWRGMWVGEPIEDRSSATIAEGIRLRWLILGPSLGLLAFLFFLGNRFNLLNLALWLSALGTVIYALWVPDEGAARLKQAWVKFREGGLRLSPWQLLVLGVFGLAAFFRFYKLGQVPPEMFSDHAEKLIDVTQVLGGQYRIFFPRNTGREAFQMYLTAGAARLFGTGISFLSLKIGTCLAGLFTLPYIYLLGKEIANRRVGLFAMFLAGAAYWPNVISRVALRFTLYPFFAAPTLYYLIRGLRRRQRNDFILAGVALGLGVHGYSPFRVMPLVVALVLVVFLVHRPNRERKKTAWQALWIVGLISLLIFLPLLRYALGNYEMFSYRMATRMTGVERAIPGPPLKIFLENMWKSLIMFQWDNGKIWVHSIPGRPALGVISAVLFTLGLVAVAYRYGKQRHWIDLALLLSIPLMMLPSALSLAFPDENPSLNRSGGALIPVFLIASLMLDQLWLSLKKALPPRRGKWLAWSVVVLLLFFSGRANAGLVFQEYKDQFQAKAWNTSELGAVIHEFANTIGSYEQAWVVPYPHWVDTRLVGIHAEGQVVDYALWRDDLPRSKEKPPPKLFLVKPEDEQTMNMLRELYPAGVESVYISDQHSQNFLLYYVLK